MDIRGGAPGTLETALLSPFSSVGELHAVLLTGGSAPGLGAAAGRVRLSAGGGLRLPDPVRPHTLGHGGGHLRSGLGERASCPRPEDAYQAAGPRRARGRRGLGRSGHRSDGGQDPRGAGHDEGRAWPSSARGGRAEAVTVSALTVVNAFGDVLDERRVGPRRGTAGRGVRRQQGSCCCRMAGRPTVSRRGEHHLRWS